MCSRFLSQVVIFVSTAFLIACSSQAKMTKAPTETAPAGKISPSAEFIKPQLDARIQQMVSDGKSLPVDANWKALSRFEADIKTLRSENIRQKEADEIYIETVMMVIKEFPRRKEFQKSKCAQYRSQILAEYDPQNVTNPSPAVGQGLKILDIFCQ